MATSSSDYAEFVAKAAILQEAASYRIDEVLEHLGIALKRDSVQYTGSCPVHGGDRRDALRLFHDGHTIRGNWVCYTRHCENYFKKSFLGFVRGVLSHQSYGWAAPTDRQVSFKDTVYYVAKLIGANLKDITVDFAEIERRRFASRLKSLIKSPAAVTSVALTRDEVRKHLKIPADYYVERGYSEAVLNTYDVGLYPRPDRPLGNRVVVPIYDDDYRFVVGFTGRSIFSCCTKCGFYHTQSCPSTWTEKVSAGKWRNHPKDFNCHSFLYNFWMAAPAIRDSGTVIIAEGPGEVWRLVEAGIANAVALFGCRLSDEQQILLERSGALTVVVLLNNDKAGEEGRADMVRRLSRSYKILCPTLPANDVGDMSVTAVQRLSQMWS